MTTAEVVGRQRLQALATAPSGSAALAACCSVLVPTIERVSCALERVPCEFMAQGRIVCEAVDGGGKFADGLGRRRNPDPAALVDDVAGPARSHR